ncbi:tyrosinase family protein [Dyadobacter fermentans]|uniref:Tyrosinase n=1 Tax=Dyadobacter fermentans (strain ATCC 700827 / DSM 18053 / CIP 107007 / KCTC 52180 / NS114) TaxID=471854 RepID=C6VUT6_DYAFD|nr:tyrosinase family protein [Dyadobacter fermentans]ACT93073.1 tyrosinase [Dyadobacter fermentans DSM 18053]
MAQYVRNNAWNNGGTFDNKDLYWYARGVEAMMARPIADSASWWFYAAIHGEYANPNTPWYPRPAAFPGWSFIQGTPQVPTTPLPDSATMDLYWNQCQHGSWYFFPWHRGYLMSLETQLRADIVAAGGPDTWALPYWNYFGGQGGSQSQMPPAFAAETLPEGTPNALFVTMRYGPDGDGNIYVPCPPKYPTGPINAKAMKNDLFTGSDAVTRPPGFGGPQTTFAHNGSPHGNFESNPHDLVHGYVGGQPGPSDAIYGIMGDPGTAALDPIFYLHHCNIDRMWEAWNDQGNSNPTVSSWTNGPSRQFAMPTASGKPWNYTPGDVSTLANLDYSYESLGIEDAPQAPKTQPALTLAKRLETLGASPEASNASLEAAASTAPRKTELLGASPTALKLSKTPIEITVALDASTRKAAEVSLLKASVSALPDKAYLRLENVSGIYDATILGISVSTPESGGSYLVGHVALFGLRRATVSDGQHGGEGLSFILDITPFIDELHLNNALNADAVKVAIVPDKPLPDGTEVTIGRVSIYREAF